MDERLLPNDDNDDHNDVNNNVNVNVNNHPNDVLSQSQASLQRSASLLERIRTQREREAQELASTSMAATLTPTTTRTATTTATTTTTSDMGRMDLEAALFAAAPAASAGPVSIPNYAPIAQDAMETSVAPPPPGAPPPPPSPSSSHNNNNNNNNNNSSSSMLGASSLNFSGLVRGFGAPQQQPLLEGEAAQGLLSSQQQSPLNGSAYTISGYFQMFVNDIYTYFRSLPIPVQAFLIVLMLWVAWRFI